LMWWISGTNNGMYIADRTFICQYHLFPELCDYDSIEDYCEKRNRNLKRVLKLDKTFKKLFYVEQRPYRVLKCMYFYNDILLFKSKLLGSKCSFPEYMKKEIKVVVKELNRIIKE